MTWFLGPLRDAFAAGDPDRMRAEYMRARRRPLSAPVLLLFQALYPMEEFVQIPPELDRRIAEEGLAQASRWLLDTYIRAWRAEVPEAAREALASGPVLVYGDHLSLLTPFLVAAAVDRPDLRIISVEYVHHFLPSYAPYSLPVSTPSAGLQGWTWADLRGLLESKLLEIVTGWRPARARERNRESLRAGALHLRQGGCVLIAPAGGPIRARPWYSGIGYIVAGALGGGTAPSLRLLPYQELHLSPHRVNVCLRRGPVARFERQVLYRRPATIRFAEPVPAQEVVPEGATPEETTQHLEAHYRKLFPKERGRGPS